MTELAYIVHQIPGRVRLRIRDKRQDQGYFDELCRRLEPIGCIDDVRVNCNTGSVILRHPDTTYAEVETELRQLELFDIVAGPEPAAPALKSLVSNISRLDQLIDEESGGVVDLRTFVVVALTLLALVQVRRGQLLGPALPLLWNVFELAGRFNRGAPDAAADDG